MLTTIFGLILLVFPFILISLFPDKKRGFLYVLFFWLLFQTLLALITQSLKISYYWVEIGCTIIADLAILYYFWGTKKQKLFLDIKKIDWVVVVVALISILCLLQVHYNYTGKISLATDEIGTYHQVKNMVYPYPYLSDEWYAVSLINGAIENHFLPVINTLNNKIFIDLQLFFHSFMAQIMLVLNLNPLLGYTALSAVFNSLLILLVFIFLRLNNISKKASAICSLLGLYIVSGANLPGLWHFIPFNLGLLFFLLSLCFIEFANPKIVFLSSIFSCLFYPPLFLFNLLFLIIFTIQKKITKTVIKIFLLLTIILLTVYCAVFFLLPDSAKNILSINHLMSRVFFVSLLYPLSPQINFYDVIPLSAILLSIFGIYYLYKNKNWLLLSELILGSVFWIFCALSKYRFFMGYERVVIFVSLILIIISGFGLLNLENYFKNKKIIKILESIILFLFLISTPFYTMGEAWRNVISIDYTNGYIETPRAPANNILTSEDLRIFKNIKKQTFLSLPWKGTVIGVATNNYPILTKGGTISMGPRDLLDNFLNANCQGKNTLAKKFNLDYIYVYEFDCPGFMKINESNEGLILYKTTYK